MVSTRVPEAAQAQMQPATPRWLMSGVTSTGALKAGLPGTHAQTNTHVRTQARMHTRTHAHTYMYTHTRARAHTHTQMCLQPSRPGRQSRAHKPGLRRVHPLRHGPDHPLVGCSGLFCPASLGGLVFQAHASLLFERPAAVHAENGQRPSNRGSVAR